MYTVGALVEWHIIFFEKNLNYLDYFPLADS